MVRQIKSTQHLKTIARPRRHDRTADTGTRRWQQTAKAFLRQHPLCAMCEARGELTPAAVVDHITPHKGDCGLFWDAENWQPLCKLCHDRDKRRQERAARG